MGIIGRMREVFAVSSAKREATRIMQTPGFKPAPDVQKFIEFEDRRYPFPVNGTNDQIEQHLRSKTQNLIEYIKLGLSKGQDDAVLEGLRMLSHYFGVDRNGGIPTALATVLRKELPADRSDFIDKVQDLIDQQLEMPNHVRAQKELWARATRHKRYPGDFLNEISNTIAPNEYRGAIADVMGYDHN